MPRDFNTPLTAEEEWAFQVWKQRYAPNDSGADYDLRGAFKAGLQPDPQTGHWADTFKKPNHPTFSDQSQYAPYGNPGSWNGDTFIPPSGAAPLVKGEPSMPPITTQPSSNWNMGASILGRRRTPGDPYGLYANAMRTGQVPPDLGGLDQARGVSGIAPPPTPVETTGMTTGMMGTGGTLQPTLPIGQAAIANTNAVPGGLNTAPPAATTGMADAALIAGPAALQGGINLTRGLLGQADPGDTSGAYNEMLRGIEEPTVSQPGAAALVGPPRFGRRPVAQIGGRRPMNLY